MPQEIVVSELLSLPNDRYFDVSLEFHFEPVVSFIRMFTISHKLANTIKNMHQTPVGYPHLDN